VTLFFTALLFVIGSSADMRCADGRAPGPIGMLPPGHWLSKGAAKESNMRFFLAGLQFPHFGLCWYIYIYTYQYVRIYIKDSYTDGYIHKDDLPGWTVGPLDRVIRRIPVEVIDMLSNLTVPVPWHRPTGSSQCGPRHQGSLLGKYEEKYGEIMRNRKSENFQWLPGISVG